MSSDALTWIAVAAGIVGLAVLAIYLLGPGIEECLGQKDRFTEHENNG